MSDTRALRRSWLPWLPLLVVFVISLGIGGFGSTGPATNEDRQLALGKSVACPICNGETIAESNSDIARNIRVDIAKRIDQGETDDQIYAYLSQQYPGFVLTPSSTGWVSLVWIVPVAAFVVALVALALVFRRWQTPASSLVTDADRELVERAQRSRASDER